MKTILLIGGTTEARQAASGLEELGYRVVVSVATGLGEMFAPGTGVVTGRKDEEELAGEVTRQGACALVDCAHPFALEVHRAARGAAGAAGVPYLRFTRAPAEGDAGVMRAANWDDAVETLRQRGGRALLTIGVRNLERFVRAGIGLTARVLPLPESVGECYRAGLKPEDIIAAFPPHDVDFNRACIRKAGADIIVTKDSGSEGGVAEKCEAARAEGIDVLIVERPGEADAATGFDELAARLDEALGS